VIQRRGFLTGIAAALCAPAIIRTPGLIMPVRALKLPRTIRVQFDVQAIRDRNVLLHIDDYAGRPLNWGPRTIIQQLDADTGIWNTVSDIAA
jgi:hypothetical protein